MKKLCGDLLLDWVKNLLAVRYISFKEGAIRFGNERMIFVNVFPLIEEFRLHKSIDTKNYESISYLSFKESNYMFTHTNFFKFAKNLEQVQEVSRNVFYTIGWGEVEFMKTSKEMDFVLIRGKNIAFSEEIKNKFGAQKEPVDFMAAGIFAGAWQAFSNKTIHCIEVSCRAQKDSMDCQFVASTEDKILKYISEFAPERLNKVEGFLEEVINLEKALGIAYE